MPDLLESSSQLLHLVIIQE